jgi:DNA ligase D-like protein (predicted 3'-phosphoesterase)
MTLAEYRRKRDFRRTAEPRGGRRRHRTQPRFVVQCHDASTLHYDFRLEVDGVLKSWSVPKGPSTNPADKRLAIPTEDHPLEYGTFEGTIPEGAYGAGTVLVWDAGTYRNLTEADGREVPMGQALGEGHASFWLEGTKLRGGYALRRFKEGRKESWLLIKKADEEADARRNPVRTQPESVLSGRTLAQIAKGLR